MIKMIKFRRLFMDFIDNFQIPPRIKLLNPICLVKYLKKMTFLWYLKGWALSLLGEKEALRILKSNLNSLTK